MTTYALNGVFTKESLIKFMTPLNDLMRLGANKVLLRFSKVDNSLKIKYRSENLEVVSYINFHADTIKDFVIESDVKLGIYDLNEFFSVCKVFDSGFNLKYDAQEYKIFLECQNNGFDHAIQYRPCDENIITKAPSTIDTTVAKLALSFAWEPSKMALFVKGIGVIKYKNILIEGKKDESFVSLCICEKETDNTTYKVKMSTLKPNSEDFKAAFTKDIISSIISSSIKEYAVNLYKVKSGSGLVPLLEFIGANDTYSATYYINPVILTK